MSDTESEYYQPAPIPDQKTKPTRKPSTKLSGKRKSDSTLTKTTRASKLTNTGLDIFGISHSYESDTELNTGSSCLPSFFVNRVANGCERRTASTDGEYYIDCKVYKASDARLTDSQELWKKALVHVKFQSNADSPQWRKLQEFVRSADVLFSEQPKFYDK